MGKSKNPTKNYLRLLGEADAKQAELAAEKCRAERAARLHEAKTRKKLKPLADMVGELKTGLENIDTAFNKSALRSPITSINCAKRADGFPPTRVHFKIHGYESFADAQHPLDDRDGKAPYFSLSFNKNLACNHEHWSDRISMETALSKVFKIAIQNLSRTQLAALEKTLKARGPKP